jgi:tRNA threonylcarbamoyladenosine biosynthesis protein TsaB
VRLLAVDTALGACSVGLLDGDRLAAWAREPMTRGHQERLAPMAAEVALEAGVIFADLDRVAVCVGPGSFTGVRVGVAFAKGLASALSIPCVGVGALEALAAGVEAGWVVAVIDARRDQFYLQAFTDARATTPPSVVPAAEAGAWMAALFPAPDVHLVGPGAALLAERVGSAPFTAVAAPSPAALARLGAAAEPAASLSRPL